MTQCIFETTYMFPGKQMLLLASNILVILINVYT